MKKIFKLLLICITAIIFTLTITACGNNGNDYELDTNVPANSRTLASPTCKVFGNVISWNAVENADSYEIDIDGKTETTAELRFAVSGIDGFTATVQAKTAKSGYTNSAKTTVTGESLVDFDFVDIDGGSGLETAYTSIENRMHPKQNSTAIKFKSVTYFSDTIEYLFVSGQTKCLYFEQSLINLKLVLEDRTTPLILVLDNSAIVDWENMDNERAIISYANAVAGTDAGLIIVSTGVNSQSYNEIYFPQNAQGEYVTNGIFSESREAILDDYFMRKAENNQNGAKAKPTIDIGNVLICGDADIYFEGGRGQDGGEVGDSVLGKVGGDGAEAIVCNSVLFNLNGTIAYLCGGRGGNGSKGTNGNVTNGKNSAVILKGLGFLLNGNLEILT